MGILGPPEGQAEFGRLPSDLAALHAEHFPLASVTLSIVRRASPHPAALQPGGCPLASGIGAPEGTIAKTSAPRITWSPNGGSSMFNRVLAIVFAVATCLSVSAQTENPLTTAQVVARCTDSVVLIEVNDAFGKLASSGSGFIVSADGKIATNHHVIANAHIVTVKLNNGASFQMKRVVADDPTHDVAIIEVPGMNLPTLNLAPSGSVAVGQHVVAIGSPGMLGPEVLQNSASDGIVSGIREFQGIKLIQTTAPISPGNSGGPLLSTEGKVVGLTAYGLQALKGENLNFAVSADAVATLLYTANLAPPHPAENSASTLLNSAAPWTSMTSGTDYSIRIDGDHMYVDRTNVAEKARNGGYFERGELRKAGEHWAGKIVTHGGCYCKRRVRACTIEADVEITNMSASRMEGKILTWDWNRFNCCKGTPNDAKMESFVWIPKN